MKLKASGTAKRRSEGPIGSLMRSTRRDVVIDVRPWEQSPADDDV